MTDRAPSTAAVQPHSTGLVEASQWKEYTTDSGRKYWYNKQTKEKSWNAPEGIPKVPKVLKANDEDAEKIISGSTAKLADLKNPVKDKSVSAAAASKASSNETASAVTPAMTSVTAPANPALKEASPSTIPPGKEPAKSVSAVSTGSKTTPNQPATANPAGGGAKQADPATPPAATKPVNSTTPATAALAGITKATDNTTSAATVKPANPTGSSLPIKPTTSTATDIAAKPASVSTAAPTKPTATKPTAATSGAPSGVTNSTQAAKTPTPSSQKIPEVTKVSADHSTVPARGVAHTVVGDNAKVEVKSQKHHGWFDALNAGLEVLDHAMDLAKKGHDFTHPQAANPQVVKGPAAAGTIGSTTSTKAPAPSAASTPAKATPGTVGSTASAKAPALSAASAPAKATPGNVGNTTSVKAPAPSTASRTLGSTASANVPAPSTTSVPAKATPAPRLTPQQHPGPPGPQTANTGVPHAPQPTAVSGTASSVPASKGNAAPVAASKPAPVSKVTQPLKTVPAAAASPSTISGKPTINTTSARTQSTVARGGILSTDGQRGAALGALAGSGAVASYNLYQDYQDDQADDVPPSPPTDSPPPSPPADTPPPSPPADSPLSDRFFGGNDHSVPPSPPRDLADDRDDESSPPSPPADQEDNTSRPPTPQLYSEWSSGNAWDTTAAIQRQNETTNQSEDDGPLSPSPPPEAETASDEGGPPSNLLDNTSDQDGDSPNPSPPQSPQVQASPLPPDSPMLEPQRGQAGYMSDSD
ncbi:MAG: hypothetical protein Q9167_004009 [Letrouitia subvulpina]